MFGLVDVNNCFASIEKIFRPELRNKPVVVLSNNDGCVIARSKEARSLGIAMGAPYFKIKQQLAADQVTVFSGNFELYQDISKRMVATLKQHAPAFELYSIDEAFLDLTGTASPKTLAYEIHDQLLQRIKIPVSVGLAPTKTLTKMATFFAKKMQRPVYEVTSEHLAEDLAEYPIGEVWGIGRKYGAFLSGTPITTAYDFTQAPVSWVRKQFGVKGMALQQELSGSSILPFTHTVSFSHSVASTRSFGSGVESEAVIREALAWHAEHATQKMRKKNLWCRRVYAFGHTNRYSKAEKVYRSRVVQLQQPTRAYNEILKGVEALLPHIFEPGVRYWKVGVVLCDLMKNPTMQTAWVNQENTQVHLPGEKISSAFDIIREIHGRESIFWGSSSPSTRTAAWKPRRGFQSLHYTTRWEEIPQVH